MMAITLGFIVEQVGLSPRDAPRAIRLRRLCLRWNWLGDHKSFCSKFLNIFAHGPIIETDLLCDVKDRVLAFEAHHNLLDGTVECPILAPIDPKTVTAEEHGTTEGALRDVVAGMDA